MTSFFFLLHPCFLTCLAATATGELFVDDDAFHHGNDSPDAVISLRELLSNAAATRVRTVENKVSIEISRSRHRILG